MRRAAELVVVIIFVVGSSFDGRFCLKRRKERYVKQKANKTNKNKQNRVQRKQNLQRTIAFVFLVALSRDAGLDATSPPSNIPCNTSSIPSTTLSLHPSALSLPTSRLFDKSPPLCCPVASCVDWAKPVEDGTLDVSVLTSGDDVVALVMTLVGARDARAKPGAVRTVDIRDLACVFASVKRLSRLTADGNWRCRSGSWRCRSGSWRCRSGSWRCCSGR